MTPTPSNKDRASKKGGRETASKTPETAPPIPLLHHLENNRKVNTTIVKDVHPSIIHLSVRFYQKVIIGSTNRCIAMLHAFKQLIDDPEVIADYQTPHGTTLTRHLTTYLNTQINFLVSARPLSVSMGNAIRWLKVEISLLNIDLSDENAKLELSKKIDSFIHERITLAHNIITTKTTEKLSNNDVILVFGFSSLLSQIIITAKKSLSFRVVVVDSRPSFAGKSLVKELSSCGIPSSYCLISGIGYVLKDVTKVLLGAHAMLSNGGLYSTAGTALIAMTARDSLIPVIVCCETLKFSDRIQLDSIVLNELDPLPTSNGIKMLNLLYDVTPASLLSVVITEQGCLPPSSVPAILRECK